MHSEATNGGSLYKKLFLKFCNITRKKSVLESSPFNKVAALKAGYFIEKRP